MILRRLPDSRFSEIIPAWKGETVALLGGGPSLTKAHVETVRQAGIKCIAINNSYELAPFADVCYFADHPWWLVHKDRQSFKAFQGEKCSIEQSTGLPDDAVHVLRNLHSPTNSYGLSLDPQRIATGRHGGFQVVNISILAGARTLLLLGYDGHEPGGRSHWHAGHATKTPPSAYSLYKESFRVTERDIKATGVRVINCSPGSAIDTFEKMKLEDALACLVPHTRSAVLSA